MRRGSSRSHRDDKAAEAPGLTRPCFTRGLLCFSKAQGDQRLADCRAGLSRHFCNALLALLARLFAQFLFLPEAPDFFPPENRGFKQPEAHGVMPHSENTFWEQGTEAGGEGRDLQPQSSAGPSLVLAVSKSCSLHPLRLCCRGSLTFLMSQIP